MSITITIRLASTDHEAVKQDVFNIVHNWNGERDTRRLHPDMTLVDQYENEDGELVHEDHERISGNRIDIIPIPDRIIQEAEYDEEGSLITPAEYAGELRIDIVVPENFGIPELNTQVHPKNPDHVIS